MIILAAAINIPWETSMTEIGTEGAVYRSRLMYKKSNSVVSTLCYGVQWDSALQFIAIKNPDYLTYSEENGNYVFSNGNLNTGSSDKYARNNIYDMAGNVTEWTMEAYSNSVRFLRGDDYDGSPSPVHVRAYIAPYVSNDSYGFRVTLYIK